MKKIILLIFAAFMLFLIKNSYANDSVIENNFDQDNNKSLWSSIKSSLIETWNSPTRDLYIPANTWHNRAAYDRDKIDHYNERPWGIGYGVSRTDKDGNWHAFYAMEFQDSHNIIEPFVGYAYQKYWHFDNEGKWRIGIGYTLGLTARHDYSWVPFPAPLPLLSFDYDRFSIQNTYVPGIKHNTGNILFTWIKWRL